MKRILSSMLCVAFLALCGCGNPESGSVNPFRQTSATVETLKDGEVTNTTYITIIYDENGTISKRTTDFDGGSNLSHILEEYDPHGNIIRLTTTASDGTVSVTEYNLTLDDQNRVIRQESTTDGIMTNIVEAVYDDQGHVTSYTSTTLGQDGEEGDRSFYEYEYDKNGDLIREDFHSDAGNNHYRLYEYENGQCQRLNGYNAEDELNFYVEYTYDETGLTETQTKYNSDGILLREDIRIRDEYGNLLSHEFKSHAGHVSGESQTLSWHVLSTYTYEPVPVK